MDLPNPYNWLLPLLGVLVVVAGALLVWRFGRRDAGTDLATARGLFQQHRAQLEASFFKAASRSGKPRGLRWKECQWDQSVEWVRDKNSGQILVLAGVTIAFEAIEGGEMEGVEAVGNLRNATAIFFFQDGHWQTAGKAIFNLNPDEAAQHFQQGYELLK